VKSCIIKRERVYITLSIVDANPLVVLRSKAIRNQPSGENIKLISFGQSAIEVKSCINYREREAFIASLVSIPNVEF
jgi:hypothetical protein